MGTFVGLELLGTVVELFDDICEDDVDVEGGGKERDVLLGGTLQNCCANNSAVESSEGHPLSAGNMIHHRPREAVTEVSL